jgi:hypothetical protein
MHKVIGAALAAASLVALAGCKQAANQNASSANEASANASAPAASADAINGTWKTDMSTLQLDAKPDQLLLKGGQFSCQTCTPPFTIAADGAPHAVNRPYQDHISVKVDDDHNVTRTDQKGGKTVGSAKYSVSSDGNTLTVSFNDMSGSKPVTGSYTETRTAPAPAGAHAISGSWKQQKAPDVSDSGLTVTFNLDGDTLHMSTPTGQSYDAKIGGGDVPIKGDLGGTTASVARNGDSLVETDKRAGKVVSVTTMTPGSDGKLHVVNEDKQSGSTAKFDMNKQ